MKNIFLTFFLALNLLVTNSIQAQYTDVINSNKPGFSESPYSVGTGVYQFETNVFYKNTGITPTFSIPKSYGVDILFRTSFFLERLELNTQLTYQKDKVAFKNIFTSNYITSGLSKFSVGAKYLVYQPTYKDKNKEVRSWKRKNAFDKRRLIPSVAIYAGMNTDLVNDIYKSGKITPKAGLLLQHNLTNEFNLISNVFYDKIGTDFPEISYIVTATQNFNDRWSGFLEHQTVFLKYQNNLNFGTGLAYLFNKNLQINASGRFIKEGKSQGFYGILGVSYRIDKHKDSYIDTDEHRKEIVEYKDYNGGFFKRLFSNLKKNDIRKKRRKTSKRSRKRLTKRRTKSSIFNIFKKKRKVDSKVKTKKTKQVKKTKKVETELEKLEREIKELEEELEKENK
jgi:hypothetical protein